MSESPGVVPAGSSPSDQSPVTAGEAAQASSVLVDGVSSTDMAGEVSAGDPKKDSRIRGTARALLLLGLALVVLAVVLALMQRCSSGDAAGDESPSAGPSIDLDALEKKPIEMIPMSVTGYQILTHQVVPGTPEAAEAVYYSNDMIATLEAPVRVYIQVRATRSADEAADAAADALAAYPSGQRDVLLGGVVPATIGLTADNSAWIATWTSGQCVVTVKSFFDSPVPYDDPQGRLERPGLHIARSADLFQRTGQDGAQALATLQQEGDLAVPGENNPPLLPELEDE